jgi:hypothetical protein
MSRIFFAVWAFVTLAPQWMAAELTPAASAAFDSYARSVEARLERQRRSANSFLAQMKTDSDREQRLRGGQVIVEELTPATGAGIHGALLHHWRGTSFVAGAKSADVERLMKDFATYPQSFAPEVLRGRVLMREGDHFRAEMRIRQKHVLTVVMDATYDVTFGRLNSQSGYSLSRSTHVSEIESPGTAREHAVGENDGHGFLWRMNTYWSWAEADDGLYLQIESVSLSRDIPHGFGWAVRPFVQSIPRESLEFTLRATGDALRKVEGNTSARQVANGGER